MEAKPAQFQVRLGGRHRRITARWVRLKRKAGDKRAYEAGAVRAGLDLLDQKMKEERMA